MSHHLHGRNLDVLLFRGFGGMRIKNDRLYFAPILPEKWECYSFRINFRNATIKMEVNKKEVIFENHSSHEVHLDVYGKGFVLPPNGHITTQLKQLTMMPSC